MRLGWTHRPVAFISLSRRTRVRLAARCSAASLLLLAFASLGDRGAFVLILGFHVFLFLLLLLARGVASFLRGAAALLGGIRGLIGDDEIIFEEKLNRLELGVRFPPNPDPGLFPSTLRASGAWMTSSWRSSIW